MADDILTKPALAATVWITPPLLSSRLPLDKVYRALASVEVLEKVIPPMLRLASTVTTRLLLPVGRPKVAMSVLVVVELEPGMVLLSQLPAVIQLPASLTFQEPSAA